MEEKKELNENIEAVSEEKEVSDAEMEEVQGGAARRIRCPRCGATGNFFDVGARFVCPRCGNGSGRGRR